MGYSQSEKQQLEENIHQIQQMVTAGKFENAYKGAQELLSAAPDYRKCLSLFRKTEKAWYKHRVRTVKGALQKAKPLWKGHQYEKLLEIYQELASYLPGYGKVESQLPRLAGLIEKQQIVEAKNYRKNTLTQIRILWQEKKFKPALEKAYELLQYNPLDKAAKKIFEESKVRYVDQQILEAQTLAHEERYYELLRIYKQLKKITPEYGRLKNYIRELQETIRDKELKEKQEYIRVGLAKIREFYTVKDYESISWAAEEILNFDPQNKDARKWLSQAQLEQEDATDTELLAKMENVLPQIKASFKQNKEGWIRI